MVHVHVQPRAGRTEVAGRHGDALKVRVRSAPVDGKATEEARRVLAALLDVPPSAVVLLSGAASRSKRFRIVGATPGAVRAALADATSPTGT